MKTRWCDYKGLPRVFPLASAFIAAGALLTSATLVSAQEMSSDERMRQLEQRLVQMQEMIKESQAIDVRSVEERLEALEAAQPAREAEARGETGNMVTFRGGAAFLTEDRSDGVFTDVFEFDGSNDDTRGYYVGAALDLVLTKDMWGMMSGIWMLGEIGVEFKRWESHRVQQAVPSTCSLAGGGGAPSGLCPFKTSKVNLTMLTVNVAPKIKFMEGSRFRPWVIPVGLDFHVISPPSDDSTVLDIGAQFALGAEYRIWKALHLGVDGRFHAAGNQTDTVNHFGTVGGYIGIAF